MDASAVAAPPLLDALHRWAPVVWLRSDPYAYPSLEIIHLLGIGLVFTIASFFGMMLLLSTGVFSTATPAAGTP